MIWRIVAIWGVVAAFHCLAQVSLVAAPRLAPKGRAGYADQGNRPRTSVASAIRSTPTAIAVSRKIHL